MAAAGQGLGLKMLVKASVPYFQLHENDTTVLGVLAAGTVRASASCLVPA